MDGLSVKIADFGYDWFVQKEEDTISLLLFLHDRSQRRFVLGDFIGWTHCVKIRSFQVWLFG